MSRIDRDRLTKVTARLADAAVDPRVWPDLLEELSAAVGSAGAVLLQSDARTADVPRTKSFDEPLKVYFGSGWHLRDSREPGVARVISGEIVVDHDLLSEREMSRDPMYNEVLAPFGYHWFSGIGFWAGSAPWVLTFQRLRVEGAFDAHDKPLLAALAPRLTETATLATAVGRVVLKGISGVLDQVRQPALVLSRLGLVLDLNARAEAGFDNEIHIRNHRLVVRDKSAMAQLEALVARIRATPDTATLAAEPVIVRRTGKPPVVVRVLPIDGAAREIFLGARVLLVLGNLTPRAPPAPAVLMAALRLSAAEARVASLMAEGRSIAAIAEHLELSRETVRSQLKSVFAKTDTHRQAELVRMLALPELAGEGES